MTHIRHVSAVVALLAVLGLSVPSTRAQEPSEEEGLRGSLRFGQTLRYRSNPDLDHSDDDAELEPRTTFGLDLSSVTASSSFAFSSNGALVLSDSANDTIVDPQMRTSYERETRRTRLRFSGDLRSVAVDGFGRRSLYDYGATNESEFSQGADDEGSVITEIDAEGQDLIVRDDGDRRDLSLSAGLTTGLDSPVQFGLDLSLRGGGR